MKKKILLFVLGIISVLGIFFFIINPSYGGSFFGIFGEERNLPAYPALYLNSSSKLVAFYEFNESSGIEVNALIKEDFNGELTKDSLWSEGLVNGAIQFDGENYVDFGSQENFWVMSGTHFSYLALVYVPESLDKEIWILDDGFNSEGEDSLNVGFGLWINTDRTISGRLVSGNSSAVYPDGPESGIYTSTNSVQLGTWNLIGFSREAYGDDYGVGKIFIANEENVLNETQEYNGNNSLNYSNYKNHIGLRINNPDQEISEQDYSLNGSKIDYFGIYDNYSMDFEEFELIWNEGDPLTYPFIYNNAPEMENSTIFPSVAYTNDTLKGYCNASDLEDNNLTYYYLWYKNGSLNLSGKKEGNYSSGAEINVANVSSSITSKEENWTLSCLASDFLENSSWVNSSVLTISNVPPIIIESNILPSIRYSSDTLKGYCNATDADGDTLTYYYSWYKNNVLNSSGVTAGGHASGAEINVANISSSLTTSGENWILSCLAYDGEDNSSWLNSSVKGIYFPLVPYLNTTSSYNFTTDNLTLHFDYLEDADSSSCEVVCRPGQLKGDLNGDGKIDSEDSFLAQAIFVEIISCYDENVHLCCGDWDNSGNISATDALKISNFYTGNTSSSVGQCYPENAVSYVSDWDNSGRGVEIIKYAFNKNDSSSVKDYGFNGYDGSIHGATWVKEGKVGGAYSFDGNDYINTTMNDFDLYAQSFSLSFWINTYSDSGTILAMCEEGVCDDGGYDGFHFEISSGKIRFIISDRFSLLGTSLVNTSQVNGNGSSITNWHHALLTYDKPENNFTLYVDGVQENSAVESGWVGTIPSSSLTLGGDAGGWGYFIGQLDEFVIYNLTLTPSEIERLYWYGMGAKDLDILENVHTSPGETWIAGVTPTNEDFDNNYRVQSNSVLINSPNPFIVSSLILPLFSYYNDTLRGYCNATDIEKQNLTYHYKWYVDGIENLSGNIGEYSESFEVNVANISSENTSAGQDWILSCLASDGTYNSSWVNSSTKRILSFDSCIYSGSGDWNISMGDFCIISLNTNLGLNKLFFSGIGNCTINSTIYTKNMGYPPIDSILYIASGGKIKIS